MRNGFERIVVEVALHVGGECTGRFIAPLTILFHRLHDNPVELSFE